MRVLENIVSAYKNGREKRHIENGLPSLFLIGSFSEKGSRNENWASKTYNEQKAKPEKLTTPKQIVYKIVYNLGYTLGNI